MRATATTGRSVRRCPASVEAGPALVLLAVGAGCWVVTANRMDGMDTGPGTELGGLGWFVGVWADDDGGDDAPVAGADGGACAYGAPPGAAAGRPSSRPLPLPPATCSLARRRPGRPTQ